MVDLVEAVENGNLKKVRELIASGTDVHTQNEYGTPVLYRATSEGHKAIVDTLLAAGANPNEVNASGNAPIFAAVLSNFSHNPEKREIFNALVTAGADVNIMNRFGFTPLIAVIGSNNLTSIQALIDAGANVDLADARGRTPLEITLFVTHNIASAQALLAAGADITTHMINGKNLLQHAIDGKFTPELNALILQTHALRRRRHALSAVRSRKQSRRSRRRSRRVERQ
jgi:ankyrin repeat protein